MSRFRFWFGGILKRKLGEAFSPPQFTVRESEMSERRFFCVCVRVCVRKHWQMVSRPSPFFFLVLEGLPLIGMGLAWLSNPTFF